MAGTSVCDVLLAGNISSVNDAVPLRSEKDSYSLFPVDGMVIEVAHYVNRQPL